MKLIRTYEAFKLQNGNFVKLPDIPIHNVKYDVRYDAKHKGRKVLHHYILNSIVTFDVETTTFFIDNLTGQTIRALASDITAESVKVEQAKTQGRRYVSKFDPRRAKKYATLYSWQCCIEGLNNEVVYYMGRDYDSLLSFFAELTGEVDYQSRYRKPSSQDPNDPLAWVAQSRKVTSNGLPTTIPIYIHNLPYEFQWLRNVVKFTDVFARDSRKAMRAEALVCEPGSDIPTWFSVLSFRDTVALTQKTLAKWATDAGLNMPKMSVSKDYYSEIRTSDTPLTADEIKYGLTDVGVMVEGLQKYRKEYNELKDIPMTQTGRVRRRIREALRKTKSGRDFQKEVTDVNKATSFNMFKTLTQAYMGGWVHANAYYADQVLTDINSYDFASSYPAVMAMKTYPRGVFKPSDDHAFISKLMAQDVDNPNLTYHWMARVTVHNITPKGQNTYLSKNKLHSGFDCRAVFDNGRLVSAGHVSVTITDLDWENIKRCYNFTDFEVEEFYYSEAAFLPKVFCDFILDLFKEKTALKGVSGRESEYNELKQFINSLYGVSVTKIVAPEVYFDNCDGWSTDVTIHRGDNAELESKQTNDYTKIIAKAKTADAILPYQIGVWVSAWARYNLWSVLYKLDSNVVYGDTDSLKGFLSDPYSLQAINQYNDDVVKRQQYLCSRFGYDLQQFQPLKPNGKADIIGTFDKEPTYQEFKTLGAKRYAGLSDHGFAITVAGVNKKSGAAYIGSVSNFNNGMIIPETDAGKMILNFEDNQQAVDVVDRDGVVRNITDRYTIQMTPTSYNLTMQDEYEHYIQQAVAYLAGDVDVDGIAYSLRG